MLCRNPIPRRICLTCAWTRIRFVRAIERAQLLQQNEYFRKPAKAGNLSRMQTQRKEIAAFVIGYRFKKMNTSTARSRVGEWDYAGECGFGKTPSLISHHHHHHDNRAHQQPITALRAPSCPRIGSPDLQPVVECPSFCCHAHIWWTFYRCFSLLRADYTYICNPGRCHMLLRWCGALLFLFFLWSSKSTTS